MTVFINSYCLHENFINNLIQNGSLIYSCCFILQLFSGLCVCVFLLYIFLTLFCVLVLYIKESIAKSMNGFCLQILSLPLCNCVVFFWLSNRAFEYRLPWSTCPKFHFICLSRCGLSILEKNFYFLCLNFLIVIRLQSKNYLRNTPSPNPIVKARNLFFFKLSLVLKVLSKCLWKEFIFRLTGTLLSVRPPNVYAALNKYLNVIWARHK